MGSIIPSIYARLINSLFFYEINDDPYRRIYQEGSLTRFRIRKFLSEFQDKINLKLCQRAFVITKEILGKILNENPGLQATKFVELPSGANTDLFRPMPVRESRARLNIDLEEKYVGFAGTLLRHQGIDVLIDAAPLILEKESSTRFVIIGEGPMKETWMKAVESKGLNMRFLFSGQIDYEDMPTWISAMDICISPFVQSAGLRSPVKIFDYMACGKPVIASRIEGTTDVFNQSEAIKFVEPGDTEALSDAIIDLLANQKKAAQLGENGRRFIVAKYDRKFLANRIYKEAFSCKH
ncbi:MAG: glycosyltransferase family 4 protein [Thermodesulfobacteriota bacterium]|nr:glycosyltransferase family 4 protein [Thermodesulfobacteriota bacterium]